MNRDPVICLVSDRRVTPLRNLPALAGEAARGGVDLVQVREPGLDDVELLAVVREVLAATAGTSARVVVNERVDVALAAGACGVHLRGDSVAASRVRACVPREWIVGRSVHSVIDALEAERDGGCDYLVFGTVFPSTSKPAGHATSGVEGLRQVCRAVPLPVLAIGGISTDNVEDVARAGAGGVAGISVFAGVLDVAGVVRTLRTVFDRGRSIPEN